MFVDYKLPRWEVSPSSQADVQPQTTRALDHENRLVTIELARFLRGSIISAVMLTAYPSHFPPQNNSEPRTTGMRRTCFESILHWTRSCGHMHCDKPLELPEGELPIRYFAVHVYDSRMGQPRIRSQVAELTQRLSTYNCVSQMVGLRRWNHWMGPFFLYFARCWHTDCKIARGKDAFVPS